MSTGSGSGTTIVVDDNGRSFSIKFNVTKAISQIDVDIDCANGKAKVTVHEDVPGSPGAKVTVITPHDVDFGNSPMTKVPLENTSYPT